MCARRRHGWLGLRCPLPVGHKRWLAEGFEVIDLCNSRSRVVPGSGVATGAVAHCRKQSLTALVFSCFLMLFFKERKRPAVTPYTCYSDSPPGGGCSLGVQYLQVCTTHTHTTSSSLSLSHNLLRHILLLSLAKTHTHGGHMKTPSSLISSHLFPSHSHGHTT